MIVIADASPLIFLAKLNQLGLLQQLFGGHIFVPHLVADEVMRPPLPPDEELNLQRFLDSVKIEKVRRPRKKALSLSLADLSVSQLAVSRKADYVLTDDKLLRALLTAEGLTPMGTVGILVFATQTGLLTKKETRHCIDQLIKKHNLRIGIELFERIIEHLDAP